MRLDTKLKRVQQWLLWLSLPSPGGRSCRWGNARLAATLGISVATCRHWLAEAAARGLIEIHLGAPRPSSRGWRQARTIIVHGEAPQEQPQPFRLRKGRPLGPRVRRLDPEGVTRRRQERRVAAAWGRLEARGLAGVAS